MRYRLLLLSAAAAVVLLGAVSCSSTSTSSPATTTAPPTTKVRSFQVDTPSGQVSLSLDGKLPPNWPSSFPVPPGATAAGSGSLGSSSSATLVAVYTTSQAPSDAFDFYKNNTSLTTDPSGAGIGQAFAGRAKLQGQYSGSVTVIGSEGNTLIVVVLTDVSTTGTTGGTSGSGTTVRGSATTGTALGSATTGTALAGKE